LRLYFAIQFLASLLRSEGASENSPQFQLRVNATKKPSPAGATDKTVAENSASVNPKGIQSFSPGLARSDYPGSTVKKSSTPPGLHRRLFRTDSTHSGLKTFANHHPA